MEFKRWKLKVWVNAFLQKKSKILLQEWYEKDIIFLYHIRGLSSAGRALAWHARGRRFDPDSLHTTLTMLKHGRFYFWSHLYSNLFLATNYIIKSLSLFIASW